MFYIVLEYSLELKNTSDVILNISLVFYESIIINYIYETSLFGEIIRINVYYDVIYLRRCLLLY